MPLTLPYTQNFNAVADGALPDEWGETALYVMGSYATADTASGFGASSTLPALGVMTGKCLRGKTNENCWVASLARVVPQVVTVSVTISALDLASNGVWGGIMVRARNIAITEAACLAAVYQPSGRLRLIKFYNSTIRELYSQSTSGVRREMQTREYSDSVFSAPVCSGQIVRLSLTVSDYYDDPTADRVPSRTTLQARLQILTGANSGKYVDYRGNLSATPVYCAVADDGLTSGWDHTVYGSAPYFWDLPNYVGLFKDVGRVPDLNVPYDASSLAFDDFEVVSAPAADLRPPTLVSRGNYSGIVPVPPERCGTVLRCYATAHGYTQNALYPTGIVRTVYTVDGLTGLGGNGPAVSISKAADGQYWMDTIASLNLTLVPDGTHTLDCSVVDISGNVTSLPQLSFVSYNGILPPVLTPICTSVTGETADLYLPTPENTDYYAFQWQRRLSSETVFTALTGETNRTLADSGLTPGVEYCYDCILYNSQNTSLYTHSNPLTVTTYIGALAASYTLTGPPHLVWNVTSPSFTVALDGCWVGHINISHTGIGTLSTSSLSWFGESTAKTFTYTPGLPGEAHIISVTATPALGTDPVSLACPVELGNFTIGPYVA